MLPVILGAIGLFIVFLILSSVVELFSKLRFMLLAFALRSCTTDDVV